MNSLKELFEDNQAGLTVYSPDCTHSRLWGNLDHAIHDATGLRVARRRWINHDINSIQPGGRLPLIDPIPSPKTYVAHSGISIACDVVRRLLINDANTAVFPQLPESGDAKATNRLFSHSLQEAAIRYPAVAAFIDAFLQGDLIVVTDMLQSMPATHGEKFVVQCATINRDRWPDIL